MKLTILTTITNPVNRQDKFLEALACYSDIADEVIVVNGGRPVIGLDSIYPKVKVVDLDWPEEWNWAEYPRHLNFGLKHCTGDWVLRLDIDQFIHEDDIAELKSRLNKAPDHCEVMTMQKMSFTYENKYYQKGESGICIRRLPYVAFGKQIGKETDLCFPIREKSTEHIYQEGIIDYDLPVGTALDEYKSGVSYWNYDYYFRDAKVTQHEFFRASRAWNRYWKTWNFGDSADSSFGIFCKMIKARHDNTPLIATSITHPKYIREAVKNIEPTKLGFGGWGIL